MIASEANIEIEDQETYQTSKKYILCSIQKIILSVIDSLVNGEPLILNIKCSQKETQKAVNYFHRRSNRSFSLYIKCLSIIQNLIENDRYTTMRDIYYQHKTLFESQVELSKYVDDLARTLDIPRNSLHILSSNKGLIAGPIEIVDVDGNHLNCMNTNSVSSFFLQFFQGFKSYRRMG